MQAGKLVPDEVVLDILKQELSALPAGKSVLLDGFPRTTLQATKLKEFFNIDAVLSLDIPHQVIIERLGNRWIHTPSSRTYSYDYNPPKVKGKSVFDIEQLNLYVVRIVRSTYDMRLRLLTFISQHNATCRH